MLPVMISTGSAGHPSHEEGAERFRNARQATAQTVPPIWFMRQAGRYHRHYQELRRAHSFMDLCKTPRLAAEVALGPVADFDFDVAILFSDILFPLEALGLRLSYEDAGPRLERLDFHGSSRLFPHQRALEDLQFQWEALAETRKLLPAAKSLIGFVGGPWTLFVYAVEGTHRGGSIQAKREGDLFRAFAERLVPLLVENARLQLRAGAEVVMMFDTAAGELTPDGFERRVVPWLVEMAAELPGKLGYYSRGTQPAHFRHPFFESGSLAGVGVDWRWEMTEALHRFGGRGFVQGNFDPALLLLPERNFRDEIDRYLSPLRQLSPEGRAGWVCGLGHGVLPETPEENVRVFVRTVREAFGGGASG
jgi:uroporphyrinogen decarboxylase